MSKILLFLLLLGLAVYARSGPWTSWLDQCDIGGGVRSGSLTLYPIAGPAKTMPRCRTLDSALQQDELSVREISEGGDVNRLIVENHGDRPVFIMAGEVLVGARQDRILKHDLLVPAYSGEIIVAAYCVEHGRWGYRGPGRKFDSRGTISNARVRQAALSTAGQSAVWESVDETCKSAGVAAPTQALNAVYEDPALCRRIDTVVSDLRDLPDEYPDMNGVVVQVGSRIVALDVFPDRRILLALWPKLVRSYVLESYLGYSGSGLRRSDVRDFLDDIARGKWRHLGTPGDGSLYAFNEGSLDGQALVLPEGIMHLQVLSSAPIVRRRPRPIRIPPSPSPSPWPPAIELVKPKNPRN